MTSGEILDALDGLSCTDLSDALDRLGIAGQCAGIMPLDRGFRLAGPAFTLRYVPIDEKGGTVGDYIDDVPPGSVVVIDNHGRCDVTVWGDLLTSTAVRRGVSGVVIDGISRDIDRSVELGFPIFSRGTWMRTGKDRVVLDAIQQPVWVSGVRVCPGDWLRGDGDGIVAIPLGRVGETLAAARDIRDAEERIRKAVEAGSTLRRARASHNYHSLQSRPC